jgi:hypothetical protein
MSDDIVVSSPTVNAPEPQPSHAEAITAAFQENLKSVATGVEDITDYARERSVQTKHENGEDITYSERAEWNDRRDRALQRARDAAAVARGDVPQSQQPKPTEVPGYVADDDPNYDTHYAAAKARFDQYYSDPERIGGSLSADDNRRQVLDWLQTYDPAGRLNGFFIGSEMGPAMAEALALEAGDRKSVV